MLFFFSFFASVLDRPETLDLPVPRATLGAQFDHLHVCILLRCPELGQKFIKRLCGRCLGHQANFTGIKVILNRISIAKLIILFFRVIVNAGVSGYRPPVSPLKRLWLTAAQKTAIFVTYHQWSMHIKPSMANKHTKP